MAEPRHCGPTIPDKDVGTTEPRGLEWGSPAVEAFRASLPAHQKLCPLTSLSPAARANLRHCFLDAGLTSDAERVDTPASGDVALADLQLIVSELAYLPPLCPLQHVEQLRHQLLQVAPSKGMGSVPAMDASGGVASPSPKALRDIVNGTSSDLEVARRALKLLTAITREPEGSMAPGDANGPPARVTLRELHAGTPSTLGEPLHVDGKPLVRRREPSITPVYSM